jgi:hypothetical protein
MAGPIKLVTFERPAKSEFHCIGEGFVILA